MPSTCIPHFVFLKAHKLALDRGTDKPFQVYGHPAFDNKGFDYVFTPESVKAAPNPPQLGNRCFGKDLSTIPLDVLDCKGEIQLEYLLEAYYSFADKDSFFNSFFERLAGTSQLRQQLKDGKSEEQIRESWKPGIESYKIIRSQYLLYPD
jgi:uncharacterized protein YbbC (DUF1343 family)